jgi:CubicO group peptidase (beta-lactamase class C family)
MWKIPRTTWLWCLLISIGVLVACQNTGLRQPAFHTRVDQYMQAHHPDFSGTIFIAWQGKVLISQGYGLADRENDVPNTPQTKFAIGSITKSFTAMAIMILQERGLLKTEDPICKYIADCPVAWKLITLHHLLNHTSGIPPYTDLYLQGRIKLDPSKEYQPDAIIAFFKDLPLEFAPGSQWHYNASGYFLLGTIIEKVSGDSYAAFVQKNILQPLALTETGYNLAYPTVKYRASGYSTIGPSRIVKVPGWDMSLMYSEGGLYSTVGDLYKWDQALYTDQLVSRETLGRMFTSTVATNNGAYYGYGWEISQQSGHRIIEHSGRVPGFVAQLARYPDDQLTIIVLSNFDRVQPILLSRELAAIVFNETGHSID